MLKAVTVSLIRCQSPKSSLRKGGWYCVVGDVNKRNRTLRDYFLRERAKGHLSHL